MQSFVIIITTTISIIEYKLQVNSFARAAIKTSKLVV